MWVGDIQGVLQSLRGEGKGEKKKEREEEENEKEKEEKKERRLQAQQKKIERLEKKILDVGYHSLEEYSIDKIHADKWLGEERIVELEVLRKRRLKEEQEKPVQLSLFDMNW